jgi:hypothetical protein
MKYWLNIPLAKYTSEVFDLNKFIEFKKDLALADLNRLEWIRTVHEAIGNILIKFFSKFFQNNDYIGYSGGVCSKCNMEH